MFTRVHVGGNCTYASLDAIRDSRFAIRNSQFAIWCSENTKPSRNQSAMRKVRKLPMLHVCLIFIVGGKASRQLTKTGIMASSAAGNAKMKKKMEKHTMVIGQCEM
jgi:hypothetical protein